MKNSTQHPRLKWLKTPLFLSSACALLALASLQSCQKQEVESTEAEVSNSYDPEILDGRASFVDLEAFTAFMDIYDANDETTFGSLTGFESYRDAVGVAFETMEASLDRGENLNDALVSKYLYINEAQNEVRPNVPDGFFAGLLNRDGEIKVADHVYRYTRDSSYTYEDTNGKLTLIDKQPSDFGYTSEIISRDPNQDCDRGMGDNRRMKGEIQKNNFGVWAEIRMLTKRQRKRLGIWNREKADYLELRGGASGFRCLQQDWVTIGAYFASGTNESSVDDAGGNVAATYCGEAASCTHAAREGKTSVSCETER